MTTFTSAISLGDLVTQNPATARILTAYGLDYCCGGEAGLSEAVTAAGHDLDEVMMALGETTDAGSADWATMSATELVNHLEATHHRYLSQELPHLTTLMEKVLDVHGAQHPELAEISSVYAHLRGDLEPHLLREEQVLFPMIRVLDGAADASEVPRFHCGTLRNPISVMLREHDAAGALLSELSRLTNGYTPPAEGCVSYKSLFGAFRAMEIDTHTHIHKENNVLFPMVIALEAEKLG